LMLHCSTAPGYYDIDENAGCAIIPLTIWT
jgi:hypothetical protein